MSVLLSRSVIIDGYVIFTYTILVEKRLLLFCFQSLSHLVYFPYLYRYYIIVNKLTQVFSC